LPVRVEATDHDVLYRRSLAAGPLFLEVRTKPRRAASEHPFDRATSVGRLRVEPTAVLPANGESKPARVL
jgi:hypothetical protein